MGDTGFKAKIVVKRKSLPTKPINVRIQASPEENAEGGSMGSSSPGSAEKAAFKFPSSPAAKLKVKVPSGRRGSYK